MSMQHTQYLLLFLVLVVNPDQFQILQSYIHAVTQATCSYALLGWAVNKVPSSFVAYCPEVTKVEELPGIIHVGSELVHQWHSSQGYSEL